MRRWSPTFARTPISSSQDFVGKGSFDAQRDFGHLIPTITMCVLMDLPTADREQFLKWNLDTMSGADFTSPQALAAYAEMGAYWVEIVAERRGGNGTDLITQIVNTQLPGEDLSDEEIGGFCSLLHDAAQNTTMNMITHGVLTLGRHPETRQLLRDEPQLWDQAIEELLRYVSPVQGLARTTTVDVELHGTTIPAGDQVLVLYGSANHDENVYPDPEVFDITAPWNQGALGVRPRHALLPGQCRRAPGDQVRPAGVARRHRRVGGR